MSGIDGFKHLGPGFRRIAWGALGALALLAGCGGAGEEPAPEIRPVRTITIETRAKGDEVALTGTVQAQTEITQSFRIDGRLVERAVEVGDTVRAGQLIARLDPQNEESSLLSTRAQLAAAQAVLIEARSNFTRMSELVVEKAVSQAQFDQAEASLRAAESQVESLRGQVNLAENRLGYTRLVANVGGTVTARGAEPGEVVAAGRMIVQVAQAGARDAVFDVPAAVMNLERAAGPRRISIYLTDNPAVTTRGEVREVSPRADPVTGTFAVRVRLLDPPEAMRLGSTVTGRMALDKVLGVQIPATALVRTDGKPAVWVVDPATQTVSLRPIAVRTADAQTLRVESGLADGDIVVTAGVQALRPGQQVRVLESRS
ncbi:MAG: efflux RND transporter periplasmic adaptor subunit [Chromatiales bacterium]|nr:efflux RND transporter periplasmic adaptor subunit [Chromatiales bacterium]